MNIAVCITTTPERQATFLNTLNNWNKIIDSGYTFFHTSDVCRQGVSVSKNICLFNSQDADYVFCFDDDIWPVQHGWYLPYIHSGLNHACYTFNRALISKGEKYAEYETPNGCMLFFTRKAIDAIGGWDTSFKGYGYEHCNVSDRIYNAGLTPARYIDIPNSKGLFKMADCESSFTSADRQHIPANYELYQKNFLSKEFKPFK